MFDNSMIRKKYTITIQDTVGDVVFSFTGSNEAEARFITELAAKSYLRTCLAACVDMVDGWDPEDVEKMDELLFDLDQDLAYGHMPYNPNHMDFDVLMYRLWREGGWMSGPNGDPSVTYTREMKDAVPCFGSPDAPRR